jgi:hypothetical protein
LPSVDGQNSGCWGYSILTLSCSRSRRMRLVVERSVRCWSLCTVCVDLRGWSTSPASTCTPSLRWHAGWKVTFARSHCCQACSQIVDSRERVTTQVYLNVQVSQSCLAEGKLGSGKLSGTQRHICLPGLAVKISDGHEQAGGPVRSRQERVSAVVLS